MKAALRMAPVLLAAAILCAAVAVRSRAADEDLDTRPAMAAMQSWLGGLDGGLYAESWDEAAELFRQSISRDKWEDRVAGMRAPLGVMISRKVRSAVYASELVNAPPGPYVVAEFETRFASRPFAIEVLTAKREADGSWKVSGYLVR